MTVRNFFDKSVIIQRLKTVTGDKKAFSSTATVDCALQEMGREAKARYEMEMIQDRAWIGYFDIEDDDRLLEGSRIVDGDGTAYKIVEKTKKNYGINQHIECILEEYS